MTPSGHSDGPRESLSGETAARCTDPDYSQIVMDAEEQLGAPLPDSLDELIAQRDHYRHALGQVAEAADRVLAGARSYVSSMPFAAPESLGWQFNVKLRDPLGALDAVLDRWRYAIRGDRTMDAPITDRQREFVEEQADLARRIARRQEAQDKPFVVHWLGCQVTHKPTTCVHAERFATLEEAIEYAEARVEGYGTEAAGVWEERPIAVYTSAGGEDA